MSLLNTIEVGLVGFVAVSILVGLSLAAILGEIGREASALLEHESWPRRARSSSSHAVRPRAAQSSRPAA